MCEENIHSPGSHCDRIHHRQKLVMLIPGLASDCLNSINSSQSSQDEDPDFCYVKYDPYARIIEL